MKIQTTVSQGWIIPNAESDSKFCYREIRFLNSPRVLNRGDFSWWIGSVTNRVISRPCLRPSAVKWVTHLSSRSSPLLRRFISYDDSAPPKPSRDRCISSTTIRSFWRFISIRHKFLPARSPQNTPFSNWFPRFRRPSFQRNGNIHFRTVMKLDGC